MKKIDFNDRRYYLNREVTWLAFNNRVLRESMNEDTPLLERLRFISITFSNLDEFFMIRVAGVKHLIESEVNHIDISGLSPKEQMSAIAKKAHTQIKTAYQYLGSLMKELAKNDIVVKKPSALKDTNILWLSQYFESEIFPIVTPMGVDPSHPFPFLASKSLNLAIQLQKEKEEPRFAILPVPTPALPRMIKTPHATTFLYLEDILAHFASRFFPGYKILEITPFRATRDADLDINEDVDDLLAEVEKSLERRKKGAVVRLEIDQSASKETKKLLEKELEVGKEDIYSISGPLGGAFLGRLADIEGFDHLRFPPFTPHPCIELAKLHKDNLFDAIAEKDIIVHHPYEQFQIVEDFIAEASQDKDVLAIKQTLYRVSSKSRIIAALAAAARNGKQVTVLMEVKARFDEENNILMARRLEEAGCHVIYGLLGLKTHSKITLVIRREEDGIRRYCHLATGNYNGSTAKLYTDVGLFTCDTEIGVDASRFFNLLSGFSDPPDWNSLVVAPINMRESIIANIDAEIERAKRGEKARIVAKMNSLLDRFLIAKLYEASSYGVKIDLIVRGICVIRPGLKNISENIRVRSIVGRFLEHSRILYFHNGGESKVYITSADWMPRNLNNRVELMIPIHDPSHKKRLCAMLRTYLNDNSRAYLMHSNGAYARAVCPKGQKPLAVQPFLLSLAEKGKTLID